MPTRSTAQAAAAIPRKTRIPNDAEFPVNVAGPLLDGFRGQGRSRRDFLCCSVLQQAVPARPARGSSAPPGTGHSCRLSAAVMPARPEMQLAAFHGRRRYPSRRETSSSRFCKRVPRSGKVRTRPWGAARNVSARTARASSQLPSASRGQGTEHSQHSGLPKVVVPLHPHDRVLDERDGPLAHLGRFVRDQPLGPGQRRDLQPGRVIIVSGSLLCNFCKFNLPAKLF